MAGGFQRAEPQRRSIKKALSRAFSRKKTPTQPADQSRAPHIIKLAAAALAWREGRKTMRDIPEMCFVVGGLLAEECGS